MTMLRWWFAPLFLFAVLALPASALAQEAPAPSRGPASGALSLGVAQLSCPACACDRARSDVLLVQREYRQVHRKASMQGPRLMKLGGFGGAATAAGATALLGVLSAMTGGLPPRRVVLAGGAVVSMHLAIGASGIHWSRRRARETAPYRERDAELLVAFREAKRSQHEQCRAAARRSRPLPAAHRRPVPPPGFSAI